MYSSSSSSSAAAAAADDDAADDDAAAAAAADDDAAAAADDDAAAAADDDAAAAADDDAAAAAATDDDDAAAADDDDDAAAAAADDDAAAAADDDDDDAAAAADDDDAAADADDDDAVDAAAADDDDAAAADDDDTAAAADDDAAAAAADDDDAAAADDDDAAAADDDAAAAAADDDDAAAADDDDAAASPSDEAINRELGWSRMRGAQRYRPGHCLALLILIVSGAMTVSAMACALVTSQNGPRVQCSHRRITRFPDHVPDDVTWLDMSFNFLTSLGALNSPRFCRIRHLSVSHNSLTNLSDDVFRTTLSMQSLDLGYNALGPLHSDVFWELSNLTTLGLSSIGLHFVPDGIFRSLSQLLSLDLSVNSLSSVPTTALQYAQSLQSLDLSRNALTTISNYSLSSLSNLRYLSLYSNQLTSLQPAGFYGLDQLVTLDLQHNELGFDLSYPPDVFAPLVSLENLHMENNYQGYVEDYPPKVFDPLGSLKTLSIDGLNVPEFGAAFANLSALEILMLNSGCQIHRIENGTFAAFHHSALKTLSMDQCPLIQVDTCAFCGLPHLTSLVLTSMVYLKISSLMLALYGVQNQTLEEVNFYRSGHGPVILDRTMTLYLNNVCIKRLNLQRCCLTGISSNAFEQNGRFLQCLTHLDLSWNLIPYGTASMYVRAFIGMIRLESIQFDKQQVFTRGSNVHSHLQSEKFEPQKNGGTLFINAAASLSYVNLSGGINDISQVSWNVDFPQGGNVTSLDLSYCGIMGCNSVITGLTSIHTFDISGNDCNVMTDWFFQHMSTLRCLLFSNVYLREQFLFSNGTRLLQPLSDLEELDLSSNHLRRLPADLLKHQSHLKRLILAHNHLESVPTMISHLKTLEDVDLSHNEIHILSPTDRQILDHLASTTDHPFTLRLRGNPLSCACPALDMVSWLKLTAIRLDGENKNEGFDEDYDDNGRDYPCVLEGGSVSSTWEVMGQWESHWRRCMGQSVFLAALVAQMLQLMTILLTYVLWSNWTYIQHRWFVLRHIKLPTRAEFDFDVLLVTAEDEFRRARRMKQNMAQVNPRVHVALPDDVIPSGTFYADEIADCIKRSWKVILVVTQAFMEDEMSGYTVLHAQTALSDTMPRRVLLLYVGRLNPGPAHRPTHLSMERLLHTLPESSVYHVPTSIEDCPEHPVWLALTRAVLEDPTTTS
ncbi:hypothetical protein ACOMHN_060126 [Nucella lapillus]